jgi:DNA polymerase (family 10)
LRCIAAAYLVTGEGRFRINAYTRAADSIEQAGRQAHNLWQEGTLTKLPGVGGSIAGHLDELFLTGTAKHFESVIEGLPKGMFALLDIPGVGPKHAFTLSKALGLTRYHSAITKLEKAAKQGEIEQVEGFKADSQARILAGIQELESRTDRMLLHEADRIADQVIAWMQKCPQVDSIHPLGSLRRRVITVGDIDLAVASIQPKKVVDHFTKFPGVQRVINAGEASAAIAIEHNLHVDLKVCSPDTYGSLLQHFTGSKQHNIRLREMAIKKGWSLSDKGIDLRPAKQGQVSKSKSSPANPSQPSLAKGEETSVKTFANEQSFYKYMNLDWIPPELREDQGEFAVAPKHQLPDLVEPDQLKGDFHTHSDFPIEPSHDLGLSSMEQMLKQAKNLGYEYLGFSEHNPSQSGHTDAQVIDLIKRKQAQVQQINQKQGQSGVKAFNSLEIDIRSNGELALPEAAFDYLDIAIVSVHSSFRQSQNQATDRVIAALSHPKAKILGHPTGRHINQRVGLQYDWDKLFDFCLKHDKWLEINGWPGRLDLPEDQIRQAINYGLKLIIGSDAHQHDHLAMIRYGVTAARRGWAEAKHIINTLPLSEIEKLVK